MSRTLSEQQADHVKRKIRKRAAEALDALERLEHALPKRYRTQLADEANATGIAQEVKARALRLEALVNENTRRRTP